VLHRNCLIVVISSKNRRAVSVIGRVVSAISGVFVKVENNDDG
jgi:hypothetical protein